MSIRFLFLIKFLVYNIYMAQQISIPINLQSVDYTGRLASGTEYTAANASGFNRGHYTITPTININIDDNNLATFSWGRYTGDNVWYVCSQNGYHLDVQFSSDGNNWTTISSSFVNNSSTQSCDGVLKAYQMVQNLVNDLPAAQLNTSGKLRIVTWTLRAAPTTTLPNAYPNQVASEAVAADVNIEVVTDYRPGMVWDGNNWMSCNREGGVCNIYDGNNWVEMRSQDGGVGTDNPPLSYDGTKWVNQSLIGEE